MANHSKRMFLAIVMGSFIFVEVSCIKKCIQPVRQKIWDDYCYEVPVPKTIPAAPTEYDAPRTDIIETTTCENVMNQTLQDESNINDNNNNGKEASQVDACSFVAEAIFADMPVFDMLLINQGTCGENVDIQAGQFDHHDADKLLPYRNELVALRLLGKDIRLAIGFGMEAAIYGRNAGAYPKTAGIQYDVEYASSSIASITTKNTRDYSSSTAKTATAATTTGSPNTKSTKARSAPSIKVVNAKILDPYCGYQELQDDEYYTVLTNSYLAEGNDGYAVLRLKAQGRVVTPTGVSETDSFWFHAHSTCRLESPWKTLQDREDAILNAETKMVYMVDGPIKNMMWNQTTTAMS